MQRIHDLICAVNRGCSLKKQEVSCVFSPLNEKVLKTLKNCGYIHGYTVDHPKISIMLRYDDLRNPLINSVNSISKPSRRVYIRVINLLKLSSENIEYILSTSKGVLSIKHALKLRVGGELLFKLCI
jgi:small subunit ribosomal protein S8